MDPRHKGEDDEGMESGSPFVIFVSFVVRQSA